MLQLQVETISHCNAACVFCPYPTMERPKGTMPLALFQKIVDDAKLIPEVEEMSFQGLGEPLIDKLIGQRIAYASKQFRAAEHDVRLTMYTNGSLINAKRLENLDDAGLSILYVSLNAADADKRKQIMGLDDYEQVAEILRQELPKKREQMKIVVKAVASKDLMEVGENEEFIQRWGGDYFSGGNAFLHLEGNWAGTMGKVRVTPNRACGRALGQIMVLWDGRVSMCCFDAEGDKIFGDLTTQTIKEVYNSEEYTKFRLAHYEGRRAEYDMCANCTAI